MKTILLTGGTGLIGTKIISILKKNDYEYRLLSTKKSLSKRSTHTYYWNPSTGEIDESALKNVDAIIHLAGSTVNQPWTKKGKQNILHSRIDSTNLLKQTLLKQEKIPLIIAASAVGYYPDLGDEWIRENEPPGKGFLSEVVVEWEKATSQLSEVCTRLVTFRIGVVISSRGGAFPLMVKATKYWIGSPFGKGDQYMSWIHVNDVSRMMILAVDNSDVKGTYNAVSPFPETNGDFMMELASAMNKPFFFPKTPKFVLRMIFGERADILLKGARVSNDRINALGYEYEYPHIQKVFNHAKI